MPETKEIKVWAEGPVNMIFVSHRTFSRLDEVSWEFKNGLIDQWELAARCRRIEPRLKMFCLNEIVIEAAR